MTSEPVDSEHVTSEPVDSKPVTSEPVDSKPVTSEPVDSKPVDSKLVTLSPGADNTSKNDNGSTNTSVYFETVTLDPNTSNITRGNGQKNIDSYPNVSKGEVKLPVTGVDQGNATKDIDTTLDSLQLADSMDDSHSDEFIIKQLEGLFSRRPEFLQKMLGNLQPGQPNESPGTTSGSTNAIETELNLPPANPPSSDNQEQDAFGRSQMIDQQNDGYGQEGHSDEGLLGGPDSKQNGDSFLDDDDFDTQNDQNYLWDSDDEGEEEEGEEDHDVESDLDGMGSTPTK